MVQLQPLAPPREGIQLVIIVGNLVTMLPCVGTRTLFAMVVASGGISIELARVNNREQPPHELVGILRGEQIAQ